MASSLVATMMRPGSIKRGVTNLMMVNKRFLSSSSSDIPVNTCASFTVVDAAGKDLPRQNDTCKASTKFPHDWLEVEMRTKQQPNMYVAAAPSPTQSWPDESTLASKMKFVPMLRWRTESYSFADGVADEDKDGMYVKLLVPELGKEDIKDVQVEQKVVKAHETPDVSRTLKMTIKLKVMNTEDGYEVVPKDYSTSFFVKPENYEFSRVWAHVNHGVLRVFIPKIKPPMIKDGIFQVKLD